MIEQSLDFRRSMVERHEAEELGAVPAELDEHACKTPDLLEVDE